MSDNDASSAETPTRRDAIKYGGTLVAGGLAGCVGGDGDDSGDTDDSASNAADTGSDDGSETDAEADPETDTEAETDIQTETDEDESTGTEDSGYSVTMSPVGTVEFDEPPETAFTRLTHLAGMAFALGRGDDVTAMHAPGYYHALWNQFTERLPGVSLDWEGLYSSWDPDKEKLYELDSDVHLADPAWVTQLENWETDDIEEITQNVSPWFGNSLSDRHQEPPAEWPEYEYYGLWEQFETVADVFQERERYEALASIHADLLARIEGTLPVASDRPTAVMAGLSDVENPWVYTVDTPGFLTAHVRPLAPKRAFGDDVSSGDQVDMEAMLEADPDVIFALGGMHPDTDMAGIREQLADHSIGRELTAVKNDRIYAQGARYQGPILNLFQLEMTAKQLYPDHFGEWPTYESGPYPGISEDEQMFDRKRAADVINGEI